MSHPKRRKKGSSLYSIKDDIDEFRESVIEVISQKVWHHWINVKLTHSSKVGFFIGLDDYKDEDKEKYRKETGMKKYDEYDNKEKVDLLMSFDKDERVFRVEKCLRSRGMSIKQLRNLYGKFIGEPGNLSRDIIILSLVTKFEDEKLDLERREIENEILREYDFTNIFIRLNGTEVPKDILITIFSFLRYDSNLLFSIGKTCKSIYATILSTWPYTFISKKNLFSTSLIVLRSTRTLVVNSHFYISDLQFLFKNLRNSRLKKLVFHKKFTKQYVRSFLKLCEQHRNESDYPFRNVEELVFRNQRKTDLNWWGSIRKTFIKKTDFKNFQLRNIFPHLRILHRPPSLAITKGLTLRSLFLEISDEMEYDYELLDDLVSDSVELGRNDDPFRRIRNVGRSITLGRVLPKFKDLKRLKFQSSCANFNFISSLESLEILDLTISSTSPDDMYRENDYIFPSDMLSLREVTLVLESTFIKPELLQNIISNRNLKIVDVEFRIASSKDRGDATPFVTDSLIGVLDSLPDLSSLELFLLKTTLQDVTQFDKDNFFIKYIRLKKELEICAFSITEEEKMSKKVPLGNYNNESFICSSLYENAFSKSFLSQFLFKLDSVDVIKNTTSESMQNSAVKDLGDVCTGYYMVSRTSSFGLFDFPSEVLNNFSRVNGWNGTRGFDYEDVDDESKVSQDMVVGKRNSDVGATIIKNYFKKDK